MRKCLLKQRLALFLLLFACSLPAMAGVHRLGTFNIRTTGMSADSLERAWDKRKEAVAQMIRDTMRFDVVALQEVSNTQHNYLSDQLGSVYSYYDGPSTGNEILYRKSKYTCLDKGYYYLAPDPSKSGRAWDAQQTRYGCWVKLQDKVSKEVFYFCATHLDLYPISIREGARVNAEQMKKIAGDYPCVITGDMNTEPMDHDPLANYGQYFGNARTMCKTEPKGSYFTFASGMDPKKASKLLDYLFVRNMEIETYWANNGTLGRTLMPSDHMPVMCEVQLLSPLRKTSYTVSNVEQLRQAARYAQAEDLIYLTDGTYDLGDSTLMLTNTCTLEGASSKTVITGSDQLIKGEPYVSIGLRNLTFKNATCPVDVRGSVVGANGNYLRMQDCRVLGCTTLSYSFVYAMDCKVEVDHCVFRDNKSPEWTGGIYMASSGGTDRFPLILQHTLFENNSAYQSPAVYFNSLATAYLYGNSFISNRTETMGAVTIEATNNVKDIRLVNNTFIGNRLSIEAGLMDTYNGGSAIWHTMGDKGCITLAHNTIVGNHTACWMAEGVGSSSFMGGAVQLDNGKVKMYNNIIAGNFSSTPSRGDVSLMDGCDEVEGSGNILSSADHTNYQVGMFDFVATDYATACQSLVALLGGSEDEYGYVPEVHIYGEQKDVYALSPLVAIYAGQDINTLSALSAATIQSDILNVGSKTGSLTEDQLGVTRALATVPGSMEVGAEPTAVETVGDNDNGNHNHKLMKDGQIVIINNNVYYDLLGRRL